MKGTLFSADFIKDSSGNLRLSELNTDTGVISAEEENIDLSGLVTVLQENNINTLDIVYKPGYQRNFVQRITSIINNDASFITSVNLHPENSNTIFPTAVEETDSNFVLRLAYDEAAILDSTYAKGRLNTLKLFSDASETDSIVEYYHESEEGVTNDSISRELNPDNIPDVIINDVEEAFNPMDFHKIGSEVEGETEAERWNEFIKRNNSEDKVILKFHYDNNSLEDNKIISMRYFGIVYGSNLDVLPILLYKVPAIFELPESLSSEVNANSYSNKLEDYHYYEFTTNFIKNKNKGMLASSRIARDNGEYVTLEDVSIGDSIASYLIAGSPSIEGDFEITEWGISGSAFPAGSALTTSDVVFKEQAALEYGCMVEMVIGGESVYVGLGKQFLIYNSEENKIFYQGASRLVPSTDFLYDREGNLTPIDEVNFFVTSDTEVELIEIDVEDADTFIVSGSVSFNSIVSHNAPCFIEDSNITLADGTKKPIQDIVIGDEVLTYNFAENRTEGNPVKAIGSKKVSKTVEYNFEDGSKLEATLDHPLYCKNHGWVSCDPDYTLSVYGLTTSLASTDCELIKADGSSQKIVDIKFMEDDTLVYNLRTVEKNHNFYVENYLAHNRTFLTCFLAGTKITMADGSTKNIEDVVNGDEVLSVDDNNQKLTGKVIGVDHSHTVGSHAKACEALGHGPSVYILNGDESLKFTPEHPFKVEMGWASLVPDPEQEPYKTDGFTSELKVGDKIFDTEKNDWIEITSIDNIELPEDTPVYNITVENYHNYIAGNKVVHNK